MEDEKALLLQKLIDVVKEISEISNFKCVIKRQCDDLSRRIRFLTPLLEEFGEIKEVIPQETMMGLVSLGQALEKAKELLKFGSHGSQVYMVLEREQIMNKFDNLSVHFEQAISKLSYDKFDISDEVKEQVELVNTQFGRAKERLEAPDLELYEYLLSTYNHSYDANTDPAVLRIICERLQLMDIETIKKESLALHEMVVTMGDDLKKVTPEMLILLKKIEDFVQEEFSNVTASASKGCSPHAGEKYTGRRSLVIPDDFRCSISLELMKDPVIISTGQTYERASIKKWLDAGHGTCPKTQQILSSTTLTPNHVLCSLISNWCEVNGVEPHKRSGQCRAASPCSSEGVELDTLICKLTSENFADQQFAAGELRRLAKYNSENRLFIAEAGAIPHLVSLLYVTDSRTQEHAVTALLNLSICGDNKGCIIASEAVPGILHVLKTGSMEARENAAATFFSLSVVDEYKVTIGASGAIPALVILLSEGSQRGKVDAATALFNLCIFQGNKGRAVRAGVVPKLMELLMEPGSEMADEALAIMAILASHPDGKAAIGSLNAVPFLVELIGIGSPRNRENAAAVLVHLCGADPQHLSEARSLGVINPLLYLVENGSERGKRKAAQLLELISYCTDHRERSRMESHSPPQGQSFPLHNL
ncbi:RING-type E3 ubiquitin transferase [Quillaja saponaria]|uniref:RING-type E3 ubiquitin transferase n=1 Tax=Quillaja saponaria TaxID=32244 RepID=A0AAD7L342_QUISA|nr:RING-type E3 ubiquitin transferase [Quillaja saponaria]